MQFPAIDPDELADLNVRYGDGAVQRVELDIDEELYVTRLGKADDRRGEVVFAIRGASDGVLVHRKAFWEEGTYRLPSGGINPDERVIDALRRELREETTLRAEDDGIRLIGVQDCRMRYLGDTIRFVSYVFFLGRTVGTLTPEPAEEIVEFCEMSAGELAALAERLRTAPPPYKAWGRWRALAHDLVHSFLTGQ